MDNVENLLTDEFIAFSKKIEKIYEARKAKKLELKAVWDKISGELKKLEEEAKKAKEDYENGVTEASPAPEVETPKDDTEEV